MLMLNRFLTHTNAKIVTINIVTIATTTIIIIAITAAGVGVVVVLLLLLCYYYQFIASVMYGRFFLISVFF